MYINILPYERAFVCIIMVGIICFGFVTKMMSYRKIMAYNNFRLMQNGVNELIMDYVKDL